MSGIRVVHITILFHALSLWNGWSPIVSPFESATHFPCVRPGWQERVAKTVANNEEG